MTHRLRQLLLDDSGQDLIEYALLATATGFAAIVAVNLLMGSMSNMYSTGDAAVQSIWEVPDPTPSPSPTP